MWKRGVGLYCTGSNFSDLGPVTVLEWPGFSVKTDNGYEKKGVGLYLTGSNLYDLGPETA